MDITFILYSFSSLMLLFSAVYFWAVISYKGKKTVADILKFRYTNETIRTKNDNKKQNVV